MRSLIASKVVSVCNVVNPEFGCTRLLLNFRCSVVRVDVSQNFLKLRLVDCSSIVILLVVSVSQSRKVHNDKRTAPF